MNAVAVHEGGHLLAGWTFGLAIRGGHTLQTSKGCGLSYMAEGDKDARPLDVAAVLVAGSMAEAMLWGRPERFNWLHSDHDATYARLFTDDMPDSFAARQLVELKARSLLFVRWKALEAIADELTRKRWVDGHTVDRLCVANGARKVGVRRFDPNIRFVDVGDGKQVSMRRWADTLAMNGFDKARAKKALGERREN
jgi:hypothetical protein